MPPKQRITRDMIIDAAVEVARQQGPENINARTVATQLHCSTQPVMYHFTTIESLKKAAYAHVDQMHTDYLMRCPEGRDPILSIGLNYVRFGHEEKHLFRFLFESNRFGGMDMNALLKGPGVGELVAILAGGLGCSAAEADKVFSTFFAVAHGLTSLLCHNAMDYDETECAGMLETVFCGALAALEEERNGKQHA